MRAVVLTVLLFGTTVIGAASASAAIPSYEGDMSFPAIADLSATEEFFWRVELSSNQTLELIDDQHAGVYYEGGTQAFGIVAGRAHDAHGATVPTSLLVSEGDVITLVVHHRAGNPASGSAPFVYPITAGAGWAGGFQSEIVVGPKDEKELREERERAERERNQRDAAAASCRVPNLKGLKLKASKIRLRRANCSVGKVRKRAGIGAKVGRVVAEYPAPGGVLAPGTSVNMTLGKS